MTTRLVHHVLLAFVATTTLLSTLPANADGPRGHAHGPGGFAGPRGPIGSPGYWHHGHHDGRWGWWWVAGATWLFYPQPIYPYPPVVVQQSPEPVVVQPAPQPVAQNWYYCDSAKAYYPYVQSCAEGWRSVPATPPASTPAPSSPQSNWYYCDSAKAYYPYVQSCPEGWRATPASAPAANTAPTVPGGAQ
ncbi:hypothetical protein [Zoogloea sp.]|uniref:hypothetical protein n=1 Tax=Zoogloea sp. TaxID=49181 RepID=UPI0035AE4492